MTVSDLPVALPVVALVGAVVALALSIWLFWCDKTRANKVDNCLMCSLAASLVGMRIIDLLMGLRLDTYLPTPNFSGNSGLLIATNVKPIENIVFTILERVFALGLCLVCLRVGLSLLDRSDPRRQTAAYRTLRIVAYSVYGSLLSLAVGTAIAWVYVVSFAVADAPAHLDPLAFRRVWKSLGADGLYTTVCFMLLAVLSAIITWDGPFDKMTTFAFQASLWTFWAAFLFQSLIILLTDTESRGTVSATAVRAVLVTALNNTVYFTRICSLVFLPGPIILPLLFIRGFDRKPAGSGLSRWCRAAFGTTPDDQASDIESGSRRSRKTPVGKRSPASTDSSATFPVSELAGQPRAELHGQHELVPVELAADVEIVELENGKSAGDAAYIKATKGYDAVVLREANERAQGTLQD